MSNVSLHLSPHIGNYGNKLDVNTLAQSSTTPATNPIYDGNKYYYLPWMDQKPCLVVDSQWEDCTYRIESLNTLIFIADTLVCAWRERLDVLYYVHGRKQPRPLAFVMCVWSE